MYATSGTGNFYVWYVADWGWIRQPSDRSSRQQKGEKQIGQGRGLVEEGGGREAVEEAGLICVTFAKRLAPTVTDCLCYISRPINFT